MHMWAGKEKCRPAAELGYPRSLSSGETSTQFQPAVMAGHWCRCHQVQTCWRILMYYITRLHPHASPMCGLADQYSYFV